MSYQSIFRNDLFKDQTLLITGGGSGIGRCTAHELAKLGAQVFISGRNLEKLQRITEEIRKAGGEVHYQVCDIREEDQVKALINGVLDHYGSLEGVVNNAGGQFPAPLENISKNGWEAVVRNNLTGTFLVSREAVTQYMAEHGGSIVCMLADNIKGMPNMGHSGAARAGVENFCMTAAVEWSRFNVRVNAVSPGIIVSSGLDSYDAPMRHFLKQVRHQVPLKRLGTESEISAAIVYMLSPAARYMTGSVIRLDGGIGLWGQMMPLADHDKSEPFNGFHLSSSPDWL